MPKRSPSDALPASGSGTPAKPARRSAAVSKLPASKTAATRKHHARQRPGTEPAASGTEAKLLEAAERLFTAHGFRAVSVRQIAAEAGANSALVGYYFRGKDNLFAEVFRRQGRYINEARLERLAAITAGGKQPGLRALMDAYVRPVVGRFPNDEHPATFFKLSSVLAAERPDLYEAVAVDVFTAVNGTFIDHFQRCLPEIPRDTLVWRLFGIVGAILFLTMDPYPPAMASLAKVPSGAAKREAMLAQMLPAFVAGMAAPV